MNLVLKEISKKNEKVFKTFFDSHYNGLVAYANGFLFDTESSEDLVQEVFIYIWENASKLNIVTSLKSYLYAMVRNRCYNYLKSIKVTDKYKVLEFNINLITDHVLDAAPEEEKMIVYHQILKIIDTLPEKMQQVVRLKFIENYSYQEIADELNVSLNTVKTQLKRAKSKITEMISLVLVLLEIKQ
ncbi:RNA polymerase sigma-70 factor [Aestuariibaculum suncheonense]|uniref:RNA polymerase sigma-70 factor n=1 Tax=Aestuariibaculum suncheonense TaxID=1028745 RepID=A0A8J6QG13_9FLAO|nr:RNA polymerase sigma-70 factor [Aestuariibaculum suncheonense]MBD0836028.1 RNA polymerase sigma-70 factor [Aestuariibaculum suncheonense]